MGENPAKALAKLTRQECLSEEEQIVVQAYFDANTAIMSRSSLLEQEGLFTSRWREGMSFSGKYWQNKIAIDTFARASRNRVYSPELRAQFAEIAAESQEFYDPRCENNQIITTPGE